MFSEMHLAAGKLSHRLSHHLSAEYRKQEVDRLIQEISKLPLMSPKIAITNPIILSCAKYLKKYSKKLDPAKAKLLKTKILAAKLGLTSEHLNQYPDFAAFAENYRIYNYIAAYDHTPEVHENELYLGPKDKPQKWSDVKQLALKKLYNEGSIFVKPWYYHESGIEEVCDMFKWSEIRILSTKKDPKEWGGGYAYQICTTASDLPRLEGDHTFIRLCSRKGNIYSVGLYRPEKNSIRDSWWLPLRIKKAKLMSPDISEFWNVPIQSLTVKITKESFEEIKKKIKEDNNRILPFHPLGKNCTEWAINMTGFHLNCKDLAPKNLINHRVISSTDKFYNILPSFVQKICHIAMVVFFNIISFAGGSFWVDREMKGQTPHLNRPWDIVSAEKIVIQSPHKLGTQIIPKVESWRKKRVAKLIESGADQEKIHDVLWGLPSEDEFLEVS